MKNTIFMVLLLSAFSLQLSAQNGYEEKSTSCKENKIDYEKQASALGTLNQSLGNCSFASGTANKANGNYSHAFGEENKTAGSRSFAAGYYAYAFGGTAFALGQYVQTSSTGAFVIGKGYSDVQEEFLLNSITNSLMIGFKSTKPTFFVSTSQGGIDKTGRIGIGNITDPQAKLHIKADVDEEASFFLQASNEDAFLYLGDLSHYIQGKTGYDMIFHSETGHNFSFQNGNILQSANKFISTSQIKAADADGLKLTSQNNTGIAINGEGKVAINGEDFEGNLTLQNSSGNWMSLQTTNDEDGSWYFQNISNQSKLSLLYSFNNIGGDGGSNFNNIISFDKNGKVGIGTNDPQANFDVAGTMNVNGVVTFGNNLQVNGNIDFTGDLLHNGELFEMSKWEENGDAISYSNGNVGIGTSTPNGKLDIKTNNADWITLSTTQNNYWKIHNSANQDGLYFGYTNSSTNQTQWKILTINNNGQVGIGTYTHETDSKFTVNGKIHAQEVKVTTDAGADFVFNENYDFPDIADIETYINKNKHLPDIPSAEEMKENGLELGEMQIKLLQKIEELTLNIIEQNKKIERLENKIKED